MAVKKVGLNLSGSGYLFPCHCGSIQALVDLDYTIEEISGTSGGAIIASLYATGMTPEEMKSIIMEEDFSKMMSVRWWGWWDGLCSGRPILDWLDAHTDNKTFHDTIIPLTVVATDITDGTPVYFSTEETPSMNIALAARASSSVPFIYPSVKWNGRRLCDGGVVNNLAVNRLKSKKRIGIEIRNPMTKLSDDSNILDYSGRLIELLMSSNENFRAKVAKESGATIIPVDTSPYTSFQRDMSKDDKQKLYMMGYDAVMNVFAP